MTDAELRQLRRLATKTSPSAQNIQTILAAVPTLVEEVERLRAVGLELADGKLDAEQQRDAARTRIDELLVTIKNLSLSVPYPEEARNAATLIAEVGTLKARIAEAERERDEARANYHFMVERAADQKLDGYRELGQRAANAENALAASQQETERLRALLGEALRLARIGRTEYERDHLARIAKEGGVEP